MRRGIPLSPMGGGPGLCAEASSLTTWEESLVYAQKPRLTHGRRAWSMRRSLFSSWEEGLVYAQRPLLS